MMILRDRLRRSISVCVVTTCLAVGFFEFLVALKFGVAAAFFYCLWREDRCAGY